MVKLVAMLCLYNELDRGNLQKCLDFLEGLVDKIFIYDDASTDGSENIYPAYNTKVIYGKKNDFKDELAHKNLLLKECKKFGADWVLIMDGDEVVSKHGLDGGIRQLCKAGDERGINLWKFFYWNIWRSSTWHRKDYLGHGWFPRLFKCLPKSHFKEGHGLHLDLSPQGVGEQKNAFLTTASILHYGYSTKEMIEQRWEERTLLGVPKEFRIKGIQEENMELTIIPKIFFPEELWVEDEEKPEPIKYDVE